MDLDLIRKVFKESISLKEIIPSTMGEPLLFKHFDALIDLCHEFNIKMNLTTNGTFPRYGAIEWAKKIVPVGSDIKISWNGVKKETFEKIMIGSNFEKHLQNVKDFIKIRDEIADRGGNFCQVSFQITVMESNVKELKEMIQLAANLGVNRIKANHVWVFHQEVKRESLKKERWNHFAKEAIECAKDLNIVLQNIKPLDTHTLPKACPFIGKEAWVSVEGEFGPCCSFDKQKLGHFGNLHTQSMEAIFNSKTYKNFVKNYANHPVCKQCNMRKCGPS